MNILVTGVAGFIGFHVANKLLKLGHNVIGIDNLNDYYDKRLKISRLKLLACYQCFSFKKIDLSDNKEINEIFTNSKFEIVIHLGAQAGVRYSLDNPLAYADSNLIGHLNILEGCRNFKIKHLLFASSSSVYGLNKKIPFSTDDPVDHPISFYAATKKANELMSHTYSHLYGIPTTGLRFFTVYGPWGRPDMALFKFTKSILEGKTIDIYNNGNLSRDFTYIDDIIESIIRLIDIVPRPDEQWSVESGSPATSSAPYKIFNVGNGSPVKLLDFVEAIEIVLGIKAIKKFLPMQPGDVFNTCADTDDLYEKINYRPNTTIQTGVLKFVSWYRDYYKL
ncbi:NAD-dependent epimerase [Acerihabitans sp. TG2]|uniref:NAD-dependent epimerase n=1 Tax=Acerihabitans sp. TG2 TaxID=3096008 RepID=UPI002B2329DD|nr:NAD-dependent epimerase [Acerihabitans sp. TG2]MEA9389291.1 NAD-dependent epimerase [Acerihabitans sp. TG2]